MNILIIENEIYLAQKVVSRLLDDGHNCDYIESPDMSLDKDYDIILLSTSLPSSACKQIIRKYKDSIIILLVSYISDETVTDPIKAGAKDYIMKPFIMDELIRKIYHFKECRKLRLELNTLREYIDFSFSDLDVDFSAIPEELPLLIETNSQSHADKIVFEISERLEKPIKFISLAKDNWQKSLDKYSKSIVYLTDYHTLKKSAKESLNSSIEGKCVVISSFEKEVEFPYKKIEMKKSDMMFMNDNIMTINDYVKLMVLTFQTQYPDTELSKKLGISRKSLWEKRKKLGIEKKK